MIFIFPAGLSEYFILYVILGWWKNEHRSEFFLQIILQSECFSFTMWFEAAWLMVFMLIIDRCNAKCQLCLLLMLTCFLTNPAEFNVFKQSHFTFSNVLIQPLFTYFETFNGYHLKSQHWDVKICLVINKSTTKVFWFPRIK